MPESYKATNFATTYKTITFLSSAAKSTTALGTSKTKARSNIRTLFSGAVIYSKSTSTQPLTVTIKVTNGTVSYELDSVTILQGDSAAWTEEEYGVVLDTDQYIQIEVTETIANGDVLNIFIRSKDIYQ